MILELTYSIDGVLVSGSAVDGGGDHTGGGAIAHGVGQSQVSGGGTAGLGDTRADGNGGERGRNRSADDDRRGHHARDRAGGDDRGRVPGSRESAVVATRVEQTGVQAMVLSLAGSSQGCYQSHRVLVDELHFVDF